MGKVKHIAGFTLVEVVVAVGIFALLMTALVNAFLATVRSSDQAKVQAEVKVQGDRLMGTMERSIRGATSLPSCDESGAITFSIKDEDGSVTTKQYAFVATTEEGQPTLIREMVDGVDMGVLSGTGVVVTDLVFTCTESQGLSSGTVAISLSLVPAALPQSTPQVFTTTVSVRNMK